MADHIQELDQEMQRPEFESMVHMLAHAAKNTRIILL